jgi:hypothetical protein
MNVVRNYSQRKLRTDVKRKTSWYQEVYHVIVSGLPVNDYDVYIQDMDVLIRLSSALLPRNNYHGC